MTKQDVRVRRVYEEPSPDDGKRILVDPLWPRGLAQGSAQIDKQAGDCHPAHRLQGRRAQPAGRAGRRDYRHAMNDKRHDDINRDPDEDGPGDPACWMKRVCPACGALADTDPPATCPQCHAMIPGE